ncbi:MAG: cadherin-like domain-containing protein, partial [Lentisphaerae bacterium]|nr:cadherin-like domain-containing protein [Lentisphaerota bacterium]
GTNTLTYAADHASFDALDADDTTTDTFTYTMEDSQGATSTATVTVTIAGVDDPPTLAVNGGQSFEITPNYYDTLAAAQAGGFSAVVGTSVLAIDDVDDDLANVTLHYLWTITHQTGVPGTKAGQIAANTLGPDTQLQLTNADHAFQQYDIVSLEVRLTDDAPSQSGTTLEDTAAIADQPPEVSAAAPVDGDGDDSENDVELITINEGDSIQCSLTFQDFTGAAYPGTPHAPGDDNIAAIRFQERRSTDGAHNWGAWTDLNQRAFTGTGSKSLTCTQIATDNNTSIHTSDTIVHVRATGTDGAGVSQTKDWEFTVTDVNSVPDIDDVQVAITDTGTAVGGRIGTNDDLTATITGAATDADNEDTIRYRFRWTDSGTRGELRNEVVDGTQDTLPANDYTKGTEITVTVTAVDYNAGMAALVGGESGPGDPPASTEIQNTAPTATDDTEANAPSAETDEDTVVTVLAAELLGNDTDDDVGDNAGFTIVGVSSVSRATLGAVSLVGGDVRYDPDGQFEAMQVGDAPLTDEFAYTVSDNDPDAEGTDRATVTVTVNGANDAPEWATDARIDGVTEDGTQADTKKHTAIITGDPTDVDWDDDLANLKVYFRWTDLVDRSVRYLDGSTEFTPSSRGEPLYADVVDGTSKVNSMDNVDKAHTVQVEAFVIDQRNAICAFPFSMFFGAAPWFPLVVLPVEDGTVQVTLVDVDSDDTVLTARADGGLLQPEQYKSGSGPGRNGLLPGTYEPYFRVWDQDEQAFGVETVGDQFEVAYDEPDFPTDLAEAATDAPDNQNWDFRFNINLAQGFVLELWREQPAAARTPAGFQLHETIVREFSRPALDEPFSVTWEATTAFELYFPVPGTYWWRVRGFNPLEAAGETASRAEKWAEGNIFEVPDVPPPTQPPTAPDPATFKPVTGSVFNANDDTEEAMVDFSWDPVANAGGYWAYVGTIEGRTLVNQATTQPGLGDVALPPGNYRWTAKSYNQAGQSEWAAPAAQFTVRPAGNKPGLVQGGAAPAQNPNSVTFTWTWDGVKGTGVDLLVVNSNTQETLIYEGLDPDAVTVSTDIVASGVIYYFKVRGVNALGEGPWGGWGQYTMPGGGNLVTVTAAAVDTSVAGQVTFSWNWANMPAGARVRIQIMHGQTFAFGVRTVDGTANATVTAFADAGVTYHYRLLPLNAAGEEIGPWSAWGQYTKPTR